MLRSRSRYENLGENRHNSFFNMEKRNYVSNVINKLVNEEGEEFRDTSDILKCQKNCIKYYIGKLILKIDHQYIQYCGEMIASYQIKSLRN